MACAAAARSPVTITMRATPASRSSRIARGVSARSSSANSSAPIIRRSMATKTISAERHEARRIARSSHGDSSAFEEASAASQR